MNSNDTVDTFEPYLTLYQGRTPIYTIPRDGKLTVSFDLTSIDYKTHGLTDDSKLYVNVIGVFVKNNGHVTPQNGEKQKIQILQRGSARMPIKKILQTLRRVRRLMIL